MKKGVLNLGPSSLWTAEVLTYADSKNSSVKMPELAQRFYQKYNSSGKLTVSRDKGHPVYNLKMNEISSEIELNPHRSEITILSDSEQNKDFALRLLEIDMKIRFPEREAAQNLAKKLKLNTINGFA